MTDSKRRWRLPLLFCVVGFLLGLAVNSVVGSNAASIDIRVQAALITGIGVLIASTAGVAGAIFGAEIGGRAAQAVAASAATEAQADRQQAERHRLIAERHRLYSALATAAETYCQEVGQRVEPILKTADGGRPSTGPIDLDEVMRTVELIRLVAPPEVVRTARRLRVATAVLAPFGVIPRDHPLFPPNWKACSESFRQAQKEFVDAVRGDLGADPLPLAPGIVPSEVATGTTNDRSG